MTLSIGQLVKELIKLKHAKHKLSMEVEKMELREAAIVEEMHKFYSSPMNDCEIIIVLKRPL